MQLSQEKAERRGLLVVEATAASDLRGLAAIRLNPRICAPGAPDFPDPVRTPQWNELASASLTVA